MAGFRMFAIFDDPLMEFNVCPASPGSVLFGCWAIFREQLSRSGSGHSYYLQYTARALVDLFGRCPDSNLECFPPGWRLAIYRSHSSHCCGRCGAWRYFIRHHHCLIYLALFLFWIMSPRSNKHLLVNRALGTHPRVGFLPTELLVPFLGSGIASYLTHTFFHLSLLASGLFAAWLLATWWIVSGGNSFRYLSRFSRWFKPRWRRDAHNYKPWTLPYDQ